MMAMDTMAESGVNNVASCDTTPEKPTRSESKKSTGSASKKGESATMKEFTRRKEQTLAGVDMSPKGEWDKPILEMLNWFNEQTDFYTLSSCSGRIVLFERHHDVTKGGQWLVSSHAEASADHVWETLTTTKHTGQVSFIVEPLLLHIACSSLERARHLLSLAIRSGYKESGLGAGSTRHIVAIRTTAMRMEIPVAQHEKTFITEDQMNIFVDHANSRFQANAVRTKIFFDLLKECLLAPSAGSDQSVAGSLACIKTAPALLKTVKTLCESCGWYDDSRLVGPVDAESLNPSGVSVKGAKGVPITSEAAMSLELNEFPDDGALEMLFGTRKGEVEFQPLCNLPKSKKVAENSASKLQMACQQISTLTGVPVSDLISELPPRFERKGHFALVPKDSLHESHWTKDAFKLLAEALKVKCIGRQNDIADDDFRSSTVDVLYGKESDHWVTHIDNSIKYTWDMTKCMFSSGNISEKIRLAGFKCEGEHVLDMYAGIGYWTLPMLVHCKAAHVVACEWNPNSCEALRKGLAMNNVASKCEILQGDNRAQKVIDRTKGQMDRVILGLIPTSEPAWRVACLALNRSKPCMLHVHMNTNDPEKCANDVRVALNAISLDTSESMDLNASTLVGDVFKLDVQHIENVKWYAPRVRHVVIDILATPY